MDSLLPPLLDYLGVAAVAFTMIGICVALDRRIADEDRAAQPEAPPALAPQLQMPEPVRAMALVAAEPPIAAEPPAAAPPLAMPEPAYTVLHPARGIAAARRAA